MQSELPARTTVCIRYTYVYVRVLRGYERARPRAVILNCIRRIRIPRTLRVDAVNGDATKKTTTRRERESEKRSRLFLNATKVAAAQRFIKNCF